MPRFKLKLPATCVALTVVNGSSEGYLSHTFSSPGTYSVVLTATAGDGSLASTSQQVVVQ